MAGFVDLRWPVDGVLDAFLDEIEAAFGRSFYLSNRGMNRVVDGIEELGDLVDAEQCISVEDKRDNDLARSERTALE